LAFGDAVSLIFFDTLCPGFLPATGEAFEKVGAVGACPTAFAVLDESCCGTAIPASGKLRLSAIASAEVSRISVTTGLLNTLAKNASESTDGCVYFCFFANEI
jgi:hypothetical protein